MQERPILFSGEMVKAILAGRKTQTRRVVKPQPTLWGKSPNCLEWRHNGRMSVYATPDGMIAESPYGIPGDHLWVRETFNPHYFGNMKPGYAADYNTAKVGDVVPCPQWTPSIFMPRWASRISLEVTGVRVERLQEISESDSIAEGLVSWPSAKEPVVHYGLTLADVWETDPRLTYKRLWNDINMSRGHSWDSNPWVWVIEFRRKI